jgi:hypothetical protein
MKVDTLMRFYEGQNALAVDSAKATAANKTQANIEAARISQDQRRLDQETQLEHFRQSMENMRNARSTGSAEEIAKMDNEERRQAAILSKTFEGSENAKRMTFEEKLKAMSEAGDTARTNMTIEADKANTQSTIEANAALADKRIQGEKDVTGMQIGGQKEVAGMNIAGEKEVAGMRVAGEKDLAGMRTASEERIASMNREAEAPYRASQAGLANAQTKALSETDVAEDIQNLKLLVDMESNNKDWFGNLKQNEQQKAIDHYRKMIIQKSNGRVDPDAIPEMIAREAPKVAAQRKALEKSAKTDAKDWAKKGAVQVIMNDYYELEDLIAQNRIKDPRAARQFLSDKAKRLGVSAADLEANY